MKSILIIVNKNLTSQEDIKTPNNRSHSKKEPSFGKLPLQDLAFKVAQPPVDSGDEANINRKYLLKMFLEGNYETIKLCCWKLKFKVAKIKGKSEISGCEIIK